MHDQLTQGFFNILAVLAIFGIVVAFARLERRIDVLQDQVARLGVDLAFARAAEAAARNGGV